MKIQVVTILTIIIAGIFATGAIAAGGAENCRITRVFPQVIKRGVFPTAEPSPVRLSLRAKPRK